MNFEPTRTAALDRLDQFLPRAGADYARDRNHDGGPDHRDNVSGLSPYLSRRMISEEEAIRRVLKKHSPSAAEKFIEEVLWGTYWKGWLEMRPGVWKQYRQLAVREREKLRRDAVTAKRYESAVNGESGIECFDAWTRELVETGYLHNHARMWYASIWIFTLRLPWAAGAEFFMRHLLDGDPASNTLSWRWVAGLHTPGKHYPARAGNIAKYTGGRFNPAGQLNETCDPLPPEEPVPAGPHDPGDPIPEPVGGTGLLIFPDDLSPECSEMRGHPFDAIALLPPRAAEDADSLDSKVDGFARAAVEDARERAARHWNAEAVVLDGKYPESEYVRWITDNRFVRVAALRPRVGPWAELADRLAGIRMAEAPQLVRPRRGWDREFHPHAAKGYYHFTKAVSSWLNRFYPSYQP